jgi:hypothetical protein
VFDARAKKMKQLFFTFLKLYLSIITVIGKKFKKFQKPIEKNIYNIDRLAEKKLGQ